ncbi:hypothetical protein AgCh_001020 [Apium graveolens]
MVRPQAREAEAWSFKEALKWTYSRRSYKYIFELDAKEVVEAVNGSNGTSYFHSIIDECKGILQHFEEVSVIFDRRSANRVGHMLAQTDHSKTSLMEWCTVPPDYL